MTNNVECFTEPEHGHYCISKYDDSEPAIRVSRVHQQLQQRLTSNI